MRTLRSQSSVRAARNRARTPGFSLLEILISITILVIGMSSMAALIALTLGSTQRAQFTSTATTLASEKLEDINHWPIGDAHLSAGGSLTADHQVTVSGTSYNYYDDVDLSDSTGQVAESVADSSSGTTNYYPVIHNATGYVDTTPDTTAPTTNGNIVFHRRWLVESNPVVNGNTLTGAIRVTVVVTLTQSAVQTPVNFQLSMIKQND